MKRNVLLIPFVAVLTLMLVGCASAATFHVNKVEMDGANVVNEAVSGFSAGSVVPVRVWFDSTKNQSNVEIKAEFQGYDGTRAVSQNFGFVEAGTEYRSNILNIKIPSDVDYSSEDTILYVTVSSRDGEERMEYPIKLQRKSYKLEVLAVEYSSKVAAGDVFPVSVVVKNDGYDFAKDNFVSVSIPALSISTQEYVGDLDSREDYTKDNHEEDAVQKTVYLKVPKNTRSGVYDMEVTVYNGDSKTITGKLIAIDGLESENATAIVANDASGEEASTSVVALTVVLVIIFVVLLAVLVALLTKKEKPMEEVETSYY